MVAAFVDCLNRNYEKRIIGTFGLPTGVVFSQPAVLNRHRKIWVPFKGFPLTNKSKEEIEQLVTPAQELLEEYGVSGKAYNSSNGYV